MGEAVTILGLYAADLRGVKRRNLSGEVWTLNDWYVVYPSLTPDRLYNLHAAPHTHPDTERRFPGNWRAAYSAARMNGTRIVTVWPIDGVDGQVPLPDVDLVRQFGARAMSCSIATMIYHAIMDGFMKIELRGIRLNEDEYLYQVRGIRAAIAVAREFCREVTCQYEPEWEAKAATVDWSRFPREDVPYWMKDQPQCMLRYA